MSQLLISLSYWLRALAVCGVLVLLLTALAQIQ
jgi:hypothetical protein